MEPNSKFITVVFQRWWQLEKKNGVELHVSFFYVKIATFKSPGQIFVVVLFIEVTVTAAMALAGPQGLRRRKQSDSAMTCGHVDGIHVVDDRDEKPRSQNPPREEVVWGKTPSGQGAWFDL